MRSTILFFLEYFLSKDLKDRTKVIDILNDNNMDELLIV